MKYVAIKMTDRLGLQEGLPVKILIDSLEKLLKEYPKAIIIKVEQKVDSRDFRDILSIVLDPK